MKQMNCNCENCGWSEIVGSPIMCNYSGHRTWRDECCKAWKPKEKEPYKTNLACPKCKNLNYVVSLNGLSDVFQYKCLNCNSYFTYDDFTSKTSAIKSNMVEVVRCKDCKHGRLYTPNCVDCEYMELARDADWFCADGERRKT